MAGFFAIFAIAGVATFYFLTWKPLSNILAARGWTQTECVITSSRVEESSSSDGSTYRVDVRYTFEADWGTVEGNRYDFSVGSSSGYKRKARVVEAHPPGAEVACYYDPEDPSRSVINRAPGHYLWWGLFPIPFLLVGVGGLAFLIFSGKESPRDRKGRAKPRDRRAEASPRQRTSLLTGRDGSLELEPEASPAAKVIGTLFVALFWNGIVSVFVFGIVVPGFRSGDIEWFVTIFMIPFVLIGLGLIGFFAYSVLAWFNPRPHLTLANGHLTPGAATTLSWHFRGAAGRLRKLTIELEGQEKVRYRRGTNTHTDTHAFHTSELIATDSLSTVIRGSAEIRIPERTMPTFDAPNNDVEWRLKVRGDIPFWPDVADDFPITIYPE